MITNHFTLNSQFPLRAKQSGVYTKSISLPYKTSSFYGNTTLSVPTGNFDQITMEIDGITYCGNKIVLATNKVMFEAHAIPQWGSVFIEWACYIYGGTWYNDTLVVRVNTTRLP